MNPDIENKIELLKKFEIHGNLPLVEKLDAIYKVLEVIANKEEPKEERPEVQKVALEGISIITLKGDTPKVGVDFEQPKDGEDYVLTEADKKEIASKIKVPIVEKVIEKTEVIKEQPIVTNQIVEVAKTDTGEQIISKINDSNGIIKRERVEGLDDELGKLGERISSIPRGGGKKITYVKRFNLSSQLDGNTRTFTLPSDTIEVVGVFGSQFPVNFNPGTDWTFSGRTLTLANHVGAPEAGQSLYCLVETLFFG
jgi:hypothetical protein